MMGSRSLYRLGVVFLLASVVLGTSGCGSSPLSHPPAGTDNSSKTVTPIKHVIFIVGENRSFDNLFATYQPHDTSQSVFNLLSEGIVTVEGKPGPNFAIAAQQQASDTDDFLISPNQTQEFAYLPQPNLGENMLQASFASVYNIPSDPGLSDADQSLMNIGGVFGRFAPDSRFPATMPSGPLRLRTM